MKNLLLTLAVVSLMACNSTEECCIVIEPQDANDLPFEIDSIENVRQLLDSLEAIPSDNFWYLLSKLNNGYSCTIFKY